jgi:pantoate kinase
MTMKGRAFAPGHITGFFEILDGPADPLRRGSRGAGVNLSLGVVTEVKAAESPERSIDIRLNGRRAPADTSLRAARELLGDRKLSVDVQSRVQLPVGQGLGMSAAGALSTALALACALGGEQTLQRAGAAAHRAEVLERTGLGDVAAQTRGGWELRVRPGFPPHGFVDRMLAPPLDMVLCVSGEPVPTKTALSDPTVRRRVNRAGRLCMDEMMARPTLEKFFELSLEFSRRTGLASKESLQLAEEVLSRHLGLASVSMIGNSVFAVGRTAGLEDLMRGRGRVFVCRTDLGGASPVV